MENKSKLEDLKLSELHIIAKREEIKSYYKYNKAELIFQLIKHFELSKENVSVEERPIAKGVLEVMRDGYGFLRPFKYFPSNDDIYVAHSQIRRFNLLSGDTVEGYLRPPKDNEKFYGLLKVLKVNDEDPEVISKRINFDVLTPIYPNERLNLEITGENVPNTDNVSGRIIDICAPIGKGQRGLIVAPPKVGKTTLIKSIGNAIKHNHPEVHLMILLIDERPEEVTDIERSVDCEVIASTFDSPVANHVKISEMVLEKAKRLVESKREVVILLDSITRLGRAYNLTTTPSGRTLSGGLDPFALFGPKKFLGAARNIEEGGSLTIIATALVETGSRMDDVIFEEFKGTGNMELILDRTLSNNRVYPAIDVKNSGTRKDELLLGNDEIEFMFNLRNSKMQKDELLRELKNNISKTKSNEQLINLFLKK